MTYETVVSELVQAFPDWREELFGSEDDIGYMDEAEPLPYLAFGCVLLRRVEEALKSDDTALVTEVFSFVERTARSANHDANLENLLGVEIGEWLNSTSYENQVESYVGEVTKRICRYVPGLATQRQQL